MNASMIENVPLFASLSDAQRALVGERMVLEKFGAGGYLYQHGEPGTRLFLIKSGWVRLVSDQLAVLANLSQGSLLGDADVLLGSNHTTSALAVSDVEAWGLSLDELVDVVAQEPEIGFKLSQAYGATVIPMVRYVVDHVLRPIPELAELPENVLATVAGRLSARTVASGDVLFSAGQAPTGLFIIAEGQITLSGPEGESGDYEAGDLIAERNLLLGRPHALSTRASLPSTVWELSASDLDRLSGLYPDLRATLSRVLQFRLDASDLARAVALLRATPVFQPLPAEALDEVASRLVWQIAPAGSRVCDVDTPAEAMYLVEGGSVELLDRQNEPLARIQTGGYFGEIGLVGGGPYGFSAVARGNTTLWVLLHADFEAVAGHYRALNRAGNELPAGEKSRAPEQFAERHLRRLSLFAGLTTEQLRQVAGYLQPARFRAGQVIYKRGQSGDSLYLIEKGHVSVQTRTTENGVRMLASMGPGEFIGETALLTGEPHATDTFAQSDVAAWVLKRQDFETLLETFPVLRANLSRELSYRLRDRNEQPEEAAPAAIPSNYTESKPVTTRPSSTLDAGGRSPLDWFGDLSTGAKIRLAVIVLLVIWLVGIAAPSLVISLLSGGSPAQAAQANQTNYVQSAMLVAMAPRNDVVDVADRPTWTPWPTETPLPSPTATATLAPTDTPVLPTATPEPPTATPEPPTPVPPTARPAVAVQPTKAPVVAAAAVQPPAPTAVPPPAPTAAPKASGKQYTVAELRRLTACENGSKHNVFVKVVDAAGNPLDGVMVLFHAAGGGEIFDVQTSGRKGPGLLEFDLYKNGSYAVSVTEDKSNTANSDIAEPLSSVRDLSGNVWDEEQCPGGGGNTLGHNSWSVVFKKNF